MPQKIIDLDPTKPIETTVGELQFPPRSLIILLGDYDPALDDQVLSIMSRVILPGALDPDALVLDDAGSSGCAALLGRAALDQDQMPPVLGVIPHDRAETDVDANHDVVLRLPAAWSDGCKWTFQIAEQLVKDGSGEKPVLVVLFGGKDAEKKAAVRCARRGWPVLVISETGGLADQITDAITRRADGTLPAAPVDPELREIVETAIVYPSSIDAPTDDLTRIVFGRIDARPETVGATLQVAWARLDEMDMAARVRQRRFRSLEMTLILLAVQAALLAILTVTAPPRLAAYLHTWYIPKGSLHFLMILTPIAISIIGAYNSHFRDGTKWILLRGSAEALKREIFRFRARAGVYGDAQCLQDSRESKLAAKVKDITAALEQSEVNKTHLELRPTRDTKRETFLAPDEYVSVRLRDQTAFYIGKTRQLAVQLTWMQVLIYVAGGTGTLLAAIKFDIWVALATAVVTGLTTKLQVDQVETSLVQYNQTLASLRNIETWWTALSRWEKGRLSNIDLLVDQTEKTLESETAGWVHQMQSALDKLTEKEPVSKAS
jgi:hypothetical protein